MNTINGNFIERVIPNIKNATLNLLIGDQLATMNLADFQAAIAPSSKGLKMKDNLPLDATLNNVVDSSDVVTISPLQLSTTQVAMLGATFFGASSASTNILTLQSTTRNQFKVPSGSTTEFWYSASAEGMRMDANGNLAIGTTALSARLHVRGDGTNPVARFESLAGSSQVFISLSGQLSLGSAGANEPYFVNYNGTNTESLSGQSLRIRQRANTGATGNTLIQYWADGLFSGTTSGTALSHEFLSSGFAGAAGNTNYRNISIAYTINNSGVQTGNATGIFLNATETALNGITHNLLDLQVGGSSKFTVGRLGTFTSNTGVIANVIIDGNMYPVNSNGSFSMFSDGAANGQVTIYGNTNPTVALRNNILLGPASLIYLKGTTSSFPAIKRNGAAIDFRLADDSGYTQLNLGNIFGYNSANTIRYKFGEISGGCGVSTRDGQFAIGLIDANQNSGLRLLTLGSGTSYIDGYSEGTTKATNYPIVFGSRINNTGTQITGSTTQENGAACVFGSDSYNASALVQMNSTTRGFLMPRMTQAQILLIATPAAGLQVFNTDLQAPCFYDGTAARWERCSHSVM